jgi:hypothetical protein
MAMFPTLKTDYNNQSAGMYLDSEFAFWDDAVISPRELRNMLRSLFTLTVQGLSTGSVVSNLVLSTNYGYHYYSAPATLGVGNPVSMGDPPSTGMRLCINCAEVESTVMFSFTAPSGGYLKRASGSTLSALYVSGGGIVTMICTTDGTWSVVESNKEVTTKALT